jgi:hypothetical protein
MGVIQVANRQLFEAQRRVSVGTNWLEDGKWLHEVLGFGFDRRNGELCVYSSLLSPEGKLPMFTPVVDWLCQTVVRGEVEVQRYQRKEPVSTRVTDL